MEYRADKAEFTIRVLITVAVIVLVFVAGGRTRWDALTAGLDRATAAGVSAATLPGSADLIHDALLNGEIDEEQALLYRVYALYGDERLPVAYRGEVTEELDGSVLCDAVAAWETLSPATHSALGPFLADGPGADCAQ